ncbi:DUF1080 domain-containing protein [Planctomycetales bacterium 10988]|nr:DUF1080 domain-containing protein [Planctomycetales bacterium 10988]
MNTAQNLTAQQLKPSDDLLALLPGDSEEKDADQWKSLFNGKTLEPWKITNFGGEGDVWIEENALYLELGDDLTGITWDSDFPFPRDNYEVKIRAKRVLGSDFFCGVTFPVGPDYCSWIAGGWGGTVVGLSSLDGKDASDNVTTQYLNFKLEQWYDFRLRVTKEDITTWIGGKQNLHVPRDKYQFTIRPEVSLSKPFGICSWQTTAAIQSIQIRMLSDSKDASEKEAE